MVPLECYPFTSVNKASEKSYLDIHNRDVETNLEFIFRSRGIQTLGVICGLRQDISVD